MVTSCVEGCSNQSRLKKIVCYIKYQMWGEKTKLLRKGETTTIGKSFIGKSRKYFSAH